MLVERITSRQNPLVKRFRRVRTGSERHLVFVEGVRLVEEALRSGLHFESVAFSPDLQATERGAMLFESLQGVPCRGAYVSSQVMDGIADTESPQGIVALISRPHFEVTDLVDAESTLIVIADQLQNPGNLGSIARSAEAAGTSGMITTRGSVDPFSPKALRASMGSAFRLPIAADVSRHEALEKCREHGIRIVVARPRDPGLADADNASLPHTEVDLSTAIALVFGAEARGVADEVAARSDQFVHIPMEEGIDSLNVAAAAAILLFESARQRGFRFGSKRPRGERSRSAGEDRFEH